VGITRVPNLEILGTTRSGLCSTGELTLMRLVNLVKERQLNVKKTPKAGS
jgi:hypothetical protein